MQYNIFKNGLIDEWRHVAFMQKIMLFWMWDVSNKELRISLDFFSVACVLDYNFYPPLFMVVGKMMIVEATILEKIELNVL